MVRDFLPRINPDCSTDIICGSGALSLVVKIFSKIFIILLIRLMGLKSAGQVGLSFLGINAINEEFSPSGTVPCI